jgi:hypothetical protein
MSGCRIGRRLALKVWLQNPCSQAVSARTLARKVFHYLCHPFFAARRGGPWLVGKVEPSMIAPLGGGTGASTGVRQFHGLGGARRFVCSATPLATPLITSPLVTKGKKNGGAE